RPAADVDEDLVRVEALSADVHLVSGLETGVALVDGAVLHVSQPVFEPGARAARPRAFSAHAPLHVATPRADVHAILGGASGHARRVSARHHRLGRNAAGIDARSAEGVALDDRDLHSGAARREVT